MTSSTDPSVYIDIPLERVKSARVLALDRYWRRKAIGDRLPSRADIDPAELKAFLPGILLVDVVDDPFDVCYRLCGTEVSQMRGELTGYTARNWPHWDDEERVQMLADYFCSVSQRRPVYSWDRVQLKNGGWSYFYGGIWPLASDGIKVDKCLAFEDFIGIDPADVWRPRAAQSS